MNHREDGKEIGRMLILWNVTGIERQDKDFWNYIIDYDYIGLSETWLDEKGWDRIKEKLPATRVWEALHAERKNKKSMAKSDILIGGKKGVEGKYNGDKYTKSFGGNSAYEDFRRRDRKINIFTVYNAGNIEEIKEIFKKIMEERERRYNYRGRF